MTPNRETTLRTLATAALLAGLLAGSAGGARAHVTLEAKETPVGAPYKAVLKVPHGCKDAPTVTLRVRIPEGVISVKPMPKAGWKLETVRGPYAKTYDFYHGLKLSEGVREVVWSGGELPNEFYDEFVLSGFVAADQAPGATLYFPVVQECPGGAAERWIEIPKDGETSGRLEKPAPGVKLTPKP